MIIHSICRWKIFVLKFVWTEIGGAMKRWTVTEDDGDTVFRVIRARHNMLRWALSLRIRTAAYALSDNLFGNLHQISIENFVFMWFCQSVGFGFRLKFRQNRKFHFSSTKRWFMFYLWWSQRKSMAIGEKCFSALHVGSCLDCNNLVTGWKSRHHLNIRSEPNPPQGEWSATMLATTWRIIAGFCFAEPEKCIQCNTTTIRSGNLDNIFFGFASLSFAVWRCMNSPAQLTGYNWQHVSHKLAQTPESLPKSKTITIKFNVYV